ncbi:MMPL family transporter [Acidianus manzaensis]|uniref:Antibiotic transport-associated protein n=1 Tax=Acidianus manzaensis TaxID=282676 RepID=A0A1W6K2A9_9CREN|nr:MMPL family transporter [Acidianus manzaensis]ARM76635.1 antibiotic transport-associated protein [Acidianus manzaensis]
MNKKLIVIIWAIAILIGILLSSQSSNYLNYNENTTIPSYYPSAKAQTLLNEYFHGGNENNTIDVVLINSTPEQDYQVQQIISKVSGVTNVESIVTAYLQYDEQLGKIINLTGFTILKEQPNISIEELKIEISKTLKIPIYYTSLFNISPNKLLENNQTEFFQIKPPANFTSLYLAKNVSVLFVYTKYGPNYNFKNGTYPAGEISQQINSKLKTSNINVKYYLTGTAPLVQELSQSENQRQDITFALVFIVLLVIMAIYFRSIIAPIVSMGVIGLSMIFGLAIVTLVGKFYHPVDFEVIEPMISVLLGIGADYSVFLLSRFKEELAKGNSKEIATRTSVKTSGKAILISGTAVTLVFLSLSFIPYLHSWGLTIGFSVPITVLLAVTLLPIIYGKIGEKIFWPSKPKLTSNRTLGKIAEITMKKPKTTLAIATFLGILALFFVLSVPLSLDFTSGLPNIQAVKGLDILENAFGNSFVNPTLIVFNSSHVINTSYLIKIANIEKNISKLQGVKSIIGPVPPNFNGTYTPTVLADLKANVGSNNKTLLVTIITNYDPYSTQAQNLVNKIQTEVSPYNGYVGGTTASVIDALNYLLPYYEILIIVLPIVLIASLTAFLKSIKISIGAVATILLSIVLSLSIIYSLYKSSEGILFFIPITIFVLMMGLGNDYSIFILTRVKEEIENERSLESIIRAISISAGAVTALGVILASSFAVLAIDPIKPIAELGIGIAIAALLDTFVIRIFIYPALLKLILKVENKTKSSTNS